MIQTNDFKAAVGKFPTGVTIIATKHDNKLYGFTANSFVSVSLQPPLVSFCLHKVAKSLDAFLSSTYFAVSILSSKQANIAQHFAKSISEKFQSVQFDIGKKSRCPLIIDAVSWVECIKYDIFECGDHYIFIGKVVATKINNRDPSLLYFSKTYKEVK